MSGKKAQRGSAEREVDRLFAEFLRRVDGGEPPAQQRFLEDHPRLASLLRPLLETAELVERMAGPRRDEQPASGGIPEQSSDSQRTDAEETLPYLAAAPDHEAPTVALTTEKSVRLEHQLPQRLGDFELLEVVGRGGMGVVFKARQAQLDRIVAVKMILAGRFATSDDVQRFFNEAQAAARLEHPGVVRIYQVGQIEGHHFFAMDFIEGTDLAKRVAEGPIPPLEAARYLKPIAEAIEYAHSKGILHRDLKPANILLDDQNQPQVSDFGLAKYLDRHEGLTASGTVIGTPSYMSPEQAAGRHEAVDARSDVYSLGAILYAMLTGEPPFRGESAVDTILKVVHQDPVRPSQRVPAARGDLETICMKCLSKEPERRYASAKELADDLQRFLCDEPVLARPVGRLRSAWHWLRGIPLIAALAGYRVLEPSPTHRRVQAAMIISMIALPVVLLVFGVFWSAAQKRLPAEIMLAAGLPGGQYYELAEQLAGPLTQQAGRPVRVLQTLGSGENRRRLLDKQADAALLQASAFQSDHLAVVAPLYFEVVHVIARSDRQVDDIEDLRDKTVVVGPEDSGMWSSAWLVLDHYGLGADDIQAVAEPPSAFIDDEEYDAVIVTIGVGTQPIADLLQDDDYQLLGIEDTTALALQHPAYHVYWIGPDDYPQAGLGASPVPTLATMAFLTVRRDAPDVLVERLLESLYGVHADVGVESERTGILSPHQVARWQGLAFHPAARRYFVRLQDQVPPGDKKDGRSQHNQPNWLIWYRKLAAKECGQFF